MAPRAPQTATSLTRPLTSFLPKDAVSKLRKHRGIETVGELLWFLPRRYLDSTSDLGTVTEGDHVVFVGTVTSAATRPMRARRGTMLNVTVRNGDQDLDITFFSAWGHEGKLKPGRSGLFAGQVSRYAQRWQLAHPAYELFDDVDEALDAAGRAGRRQVFPVYRDVPGLPSWTLSRCVQVVLDAVADSEDPLPSDIRTRRRLPGFVEAMRLVHLPTDRDDPWRGRRRLTYDEAFVLQVVLAQRRREAATAVAVPRRERPGGLREAFDERLPFTLTPGQRQVAEEIAGDLSLTKPMNRLLQGEVGSGKTVVALRAMLSVVDAGGQAALLAPTEVLAMQHHRSITAMLGDLALGGMLGGGDAATRVALLTGSQSAAARRAALLDVAGGAAGIVIGTHALIQEKVQFADLALVVVDEQHRFGVEQRDALRDKAQAPPHVLVMTATPIPRTVAMTVFGDMDTSVLAELPAGRSPIATHVVDNPRWYDRTWQRVAEEVAAGHQVYVVCPRIGGDAQAEDDVPTEVPVDDTSNGEPAAQEGRVMRSVLTTLEELRGHPALAGLRIETLHGRLAPEAKDAVMSAFSAGEVDVLVATTVVEVGVDVPNATVMVILDADRFGVSQLHQLRGRVGRGAAAGLCLLVTDSETPATVERLRAVAATTDGFELSRLDLEQRREGDILGAAQSGARRQLRLLTLRHDEETIDDARQDATRLVDADPDLSGHPALRAAVAEALDEEQAAYLERG